MKVGLGPLHHHPILSRHLAVQNTKAKKKLVMHDKEHIKQRNYFHTGSSCVKKVQLTEKPYLQTDSYKVCYVKNLG